MKYKFKFKTEGNTGRVRIFYKAKEVEVTTPAFHEASNLLVSGHYQAGVNGKRTAFAVIFIKHKNISDVKKSLKKHFTGNNSGQRARAWMNLILNNCPDYIDINKG